MKKGILLGIVAALMATSTGVAASRYLITSTGQIKPGVLKQLRGNVGPRGTQGPAGQSGQAGPAGPAGLSSVTYVTSAAVPYCSFSGGACAVASATATCPAGSYAVGGSADPSTIETSVSTFIGATQYSAVSANESIFTGQLTATVACASGPGINAFAAHSARRATTDAAAEAQSLVARLTSER